MQCSLIIILNIKALTWATDLKHPKHSIYAEFRTYSGVIQRADGENVEKIHPIPYIRHIAVILNWCSNLG